MAIWGDLALYLLKGSLILHALDACQGSMICFLNFLKQCHRNKENRAECCVC